MPITGRSKVDYDNVLADSEREAVADLLNYLENVMRAPLSFPPTIFPLGILSCPHPPTLFHEKRLKIRNAHLHHADLYGRGQRAETDFFSGEPLAALSTLVYSQNIDLQRSASLTFAEITERGMIMR